MHKKSEPDDSTPQAEAAPPPSDFLIRLKAFEESRLRDVTVRRVARRIIGPEFRSSSKSNPARSPEDTIVDDITGNAKLGELSEVFPNGKPANSINQIIEGTLAPTNEMIETLAMYYLTIPEGYNGKRHDKHQSIASKHISIDDILSREAFIESGRQYIAALNPAKPAETVPEASPEAPPQNWGDGRREYWFNFLQKDSPLHVAILKLAEHHQIFEYGNDGISGMDGTYFKNTHFNDLVHGKPLNIETPFQKAIFHSNFFKHCSNINATPAEQHFIQRAIDAEIAVYETKNLADDNPKKASAQKEAARIMELSESIAEWSPIVTRTNGVNVRKTIKKIKADKETNAAILGHALQQKTPEYATTEIKCKELAVFMETLIHTIGGIEKLKNDELGNTDEIEVAQAIINKEFQSKIIECKDSIQQDTKLKVLLKDAKNIANDAIDKVYDVYEKRKSKSSESRELLNALKAADKEWLKNTIDEIAASTKPPSPFSKFVKPSNQEVSAVR